MISREQMNIFLGKIQEIKTACDDILESFQEIEFGETETFGEDIAIMEDDDVDDVSIHVDTLERVSTESIQTWREIEDDQG